MKFDSDKGDRGLIYDADGNLLDHPIRGDTETGVVECLDTDRDGRIKIDHEAGEAIRVVRTYKPPLRIEGFSTGHETGVAGKRIG